MSRDLVVLPAPPGPPLVDLAAALSPSRWPALFDGGPETTPLARWDMLGFDPVATLALRGSDDPVDDAGTRALGRVQSLLDREFGAGCAPPGDDDLPPFAGGVVLCLAYDLGRETERLPRRCPRDAELPDLLAATHAFVLAEERASGRRLVVGRGTPEQGRAFLAAVEALGREALPAPASLPAVTSVSSSFDRAGFMTAVERVREHILLGNVYQVNLAQRFELGWEGSPGDLQRALRQRSPAPFGGLFGSPHGSLVSSSPELFLRRRGGYVESRPIKGTRPRGADPESDARQRAALLASPKEVAELSMIVDLVRNDLGRSASLGSVAVEQPFGTDAWSTVFHRVATVTARVPADLPTTTLVERAFPPASVTGTPKLSALGVIEELEPVRRHLYTGAVGWIDGSGDCDLSVAIRVVTHLGDRLLFPVGGGITLLSDPADEYEETLHKAAGVFAALGLPRQPDLTNLESA
jgi:para-aminobenzoate synthetase component 1